MTDLHPSSFLAALGWDDLRPHCEQAASTGQKASRNLEAALGDLDPEFWLRNRFDADRPWLSWNAKKSV
ncbi:hypothetical protein [Streptomyces lavendulae]|uniref:hypothetical protein n=1 Tax=Streptomyces lavendulae TaxID=1914 RepID=UPI0025576241|nr:hypothetical protein [Streptomyces lavendulae]